MIVLRIYLSTVSENTVDTLRRLFVDAALPYLRLLELDISRHVIALGSTLSGPPPRLRFEPFGSRVPEAEAPILPETVSDTLDELRFVFRNRILLKHGITFFKLFGVSHREGVMKINGGDLALD
jgi:hypothetical protein